MSIAHTRLWFFGLCLSAETEQRDVALFDRICEDWLLERRQLAASRLHITAYPIGSFIHSPQRMIADACAAADAISLTPFDVSFDRVVTWKGSNLVLTADGGCDALLSFQHKLPTAMRLADIRPAKGWTFRPHVTLRYNEHTLVDQEVPRLTWRVSEFVLIESLRGQTIHDHRRRWPLVGAGMNVAA